MQIANRILTTGHHAPSLLRLFFYLNIPPPEGSGPIPEVLQYPGQPVARAEQAPDISPVFKNQFNIEVPQWGTYQILS